MQDNVYPINQERPDRRQLSLFDGIAIPTAPPAPPASPEPGIRQRILQLEAQAEEAEDNGDNALADKLRLEAAKLTVSILR